MYDLRSISITHNTIHPHTLQTADVTPWVNTIWCQSGNTSFARVTVSNHLPRAKGDRSPLISTMCSASHSHLCPNKGGPCGRTWGLSVSRDQGPGETEAPVPTTEPPPLGLAGSCLPPLRHLTADNPPVLTGALFNVNSLIY